MVMRLVNARKVVGTGKVYELSPKGQWCGILVPHNFYVVIRLLSINDGFGLLDVPSENNLTNNLRWNSSNTLALGNRILRKSMDTLPNPANRLV